MSKNIVILAMRNYLEMHFAEVSIARTDGDDFVGVVAGRKDGTWDGAATLFGESPDACVRSLFNRFSDPEDGDQDLLLENGKLVPIGRVPIF